jgi:beta-barrel assembly-enhancing protease
MKYPARLSLFLAATLLAPLPASAQFGPLSKKKPTPESDKATASKNEARYEKLKTYSMDKYQNDIDFRDEVDEAYDQLMREHSDRAYQKNIGRASYIRTVSEDSWREHVNLYDNLMVQDHINRIGQSLVPPDSEKSYAFKVIPDPTPVAETLATGTIYVSTGLISMLDSEAQLAYVLAHEMGHVSLDHWKEHVIMDHGQDAYAEEQAVKAKRIALIGTLAGGALGGAIGQSAGSAFGGAAAGGAIGLIAGAILDRPLIVSWDRVEEDQADDFAFKAVLRASYDVREVPSLYATMEKATVKDSRVGLGFLGNRKRITERSERIKDLIANAYKADIETQLKKGFLATSAEHRNLMAELKRDNGIMAYYHDMFELARVNLADATAIRDNDPAAHYFYAKVLKLVGRTGEDQKLARDEFFKAAKFDSHEENYGSHLHLAMMIAEDPNPNKKEIVDEFDAYVTDYARWNAEKYALRAFPPNLSSVYEYMSLYGDPGWKPRAPDVQDLEYKTLNAVLPADAEQKTVAAPATPEKTTANPAVKVPAAATKVIKQVQGLPGVAK